MHSLEHEDLCVLYHAGELLPEERRSFDDHLASCADCRALLESLKRTSRAAASAMLEPPKGLASVAAARVLVEARPEKGLFAPRSLGFALAFAALALALYFASPRRSEEHSLKWTSGIEADLARVESELGKLSQDVAVGSDPAEIDEDLNGLEESARSLKKQLLRS
jgi:hypothetical protein